MSHSVIGGARAVRHLPECLSGCKDRDVSFQSGSDRSLNATFLVFRVVSISFVVVLFRSVSRMLTVLILRFDPFPTPSRSQSRRPLRSVSQRAVPIRSGPCLIFCRSVLRIRSVSILSSFPFPIYVPFEKTAFRSGIKQPC